MWASEMEKNTEPVQKLQFDTEVKPLDYLIYRFKTPNGYVYQFITPSENNPNIQGLQSNRWKIEHLLFEYRILTKGTHFGPEEKEIQATFEAKGDSEKILSTFKKHCSYTNPDTVTAYSLSLKSEDKKWQCKTLIIKNNAPRAKARGIQKNEIIITDSSDPNAPSPDQIASIAYKAINDYKKK